tara:strand:- start:66 stop:548 length:483 start_codon:yes stop_codon:yes gene_type:complete
MDKLERKKYNYEYYRKNKAKRREWNALNSDKRKEYYKAYNKKNHAKQEEQNKILNSSIPPAVYCIKEDDIIVYVGYSKIPYKRRASHLSVNKFGGTINNSSVSQAISDGLLDRDKLTFHILEFIDDRDTGKQREKMYIMQYQPKVNTYATNKKRRKKLAK